MKQSAAVMALFLGTASTIRQAPRNINLFATGASGDEDLGQNIIMKGDKFHYNQFSQVEIEEGAPVPSKGVRFIQSKEAKDEEKKEEKKADAKAEAKAEAKPEAKADAKAEAKADAKADAKAEAKKEEKKDDAKKEEEKEEKKEEKKGAEKKDDEKKEDKKEDKKEADDEEKKEDGEEKKEVEKKDQKPGEATWEDHNGCKENEWEAADGNCAFEAENLHLNGNNDILNDHKMLQLGDLDTGLQFVQLGNGSGLWMNKKFSDDKINGDFSGKIDSVRGPPGAPIGFGVHKLASSVDPYSAKKTVGEPAPGIQHQPIILPADQFKGVPAEPEKLSPEMEYRKEVGEKGFRAAGATMDKLVAAGMTDTPKVYFNNSVLPVKDEAKDDKAAEAKVKADPNAGAPEGDKAVSPEKMKKAIEQAAKDAPNPNAKPEDPATDPAAVAAAANKMDDAT